MITHTRVSIAARNSLDPMIEECGLLENHVRGLGETELADDICKARYYLRRAYLRSIGKSPDGDDHPTEEMPTVQGS